MRTFLIAGLASAVVAEVPTCKAHKGTVWALCGTHEVKRWGVGPEGEAQAIKNRNFVSTKKQKFGTCAAQATAAQIDINVATAVELQALYGVDATKAAAIVAYRRAHGSFVDTGMLEKVEGMTLADVANVANNAGAAYGHAIVTDAKAQTDAAKTTARLRAIRWLTSCLHLPK